MTETEEGKGRIRKRGEAKESKGSRHKSKELRDRAVGKVRHRERASQREKKSENDKRKMGKR